MEPWAIGKYLPVTTTIPNMNKFCDWFTETKLINVHDSVLLKEDFYSLLSSIVIIDQSQCLITKVHGNPWASLNMRMSMFVDRVIISNPVTVP